MDDLDEILGANERFVAEFSHGDLPAPPARRIAVLTCMDARMQPERFLGLGIGDAHVVRNAGGRASDDAIRSLIISSRLLGTRAFLVIHHTDCGMGTFTDDELRERLTAETGADASGIEFLPFRDLEQSVRDDVLAIRASPFVDGSIPVLGFVYDVRTGARLDVPVTGSTV